MRFVINASAPVLLCLFGLLPQALPADAPKVTLEIRRAETKPGSGLSEAVVVGTTRKLYLHPKVELSNQDISEARAITDDRNEPVIELVFTKGGQTKMAKLTKAHLGKPLAIFVDGKVIFAPVVKSEIRDRAHITGGFTKAEAESIANGIKGK